MCTVLQTHMTRNPKREKSAKVNVIWCFDKFSLCRVFLFKKVHIKLSHHVAVTFFVTVKWSTKKARKTSKETANVRECEKESNKVGMFSLSFHWVDWSVNNTNFHFIHLLLSNTLPQSADLKVNVVFFLLLSGELRQLFNSFWY